MNSHAARADFLRELCRRHPELLGWKNVDRALLGQGDIDAAAPRNRVATIAADAVDIAPATLGATHVIRCEHVVDKLLHFFVQPQLLPQLFEFDLCTQPGRGLAPWASPSRLLALAELDDNGIRRIRPGAEAVVVLVYRGLSPRGRSGLTDDEMQFVTTRIAEDRAGAEQACRTLPPRPARGPLHRLVDGLADGKWQQDLVRRAFLGFAISGPAHPVFTTRRVRYRFQLATGRECLMSDLARHHSRRVPATGLDRLFADARAGGHAVHAIAAAPLSTVTEERKASDDASMQRLS